MTSTLASRFKSPGARALLAYLSVPAALAATVAVFWHRDVKYSLPTPVPEAHAPPAIGSRPTIDAALAALGVAQDRRPTLLHFYNPDCPCSRFNRDHLQSLVRKYGERVRFVAVVESPQPDGVDSGLPMTHVGDAEGTIAAAFGVYSTPQAVLLDAEGTLQFRGNYNTSRYCSEPATEFARLAINALLVGAAPQLDARAAIAFGCELPQEEPNGH
ncbi:MAG: hypothetical protein RL398_1998 [Planctomycetota bacterium]|jgi:hypothetical protein